MKTSVEINGYVISIEETDGVILVNALKDDEVVEEFSIQTEESDESEESDDDDIKGFDQFGGEEDDFESDEEEGQDDEEDFEEEGQDDEEDFEGESQKALESFQAFINKKRK